MAMSRCTRRAWVGVPLLFVCVVLIAAVVAKLSTLKADRMLKHRMREMLHMQLDWEMIKTLDKDGNGIDKLEFVVGMLELLGLVEAHDVEPFMEQFDALDVDGSGHLDRDDLKDGLREPREVRGDQPRGRGGGAPPAMPTTCRTRCAARTKTSPPSSAGAAAAVGTQRRHGGERRRRKEGAWRGAARVAGGGGVLSRREDGAVDGAEQRRPAARRQVDGEGGAGAAGRLAPLGMSCFFLQLARSADEQAEPLQVSSHR